jgi:acyl carrier protein
MMMDKIELSIQRVMAVIFETPVAEITIESNQDNIGNWDSLKHLDLVVALEEEFEILFPAEEIGNLTSVRLISVIVKEQLLIKN